LLCASYTWAHFASDVPLFAWSGESSLGKNLAVSAALTAQDVESLLDAVLQGRNIPSTFSSQPLTLKPELLILFLEPHLRIDQIAALPTQFSVLKNAMQNGASSLYAPHVDLPESLSAVIVNAVLAAKANDATTIYAGRGTSLLPDLKRREPSVQAVTIPKLQEILSSDTDIFNNGKTDLVIVHLDHAYQDLVDKFEKTNNVINQVHLLLSHKTSSYLALYTGLAYDDPLWLVDFGDNAIKRAFEAFQDVQFYDQSNITNGTTPTWFQQFFPGWFWEVALVVVFVLPIIFTGYSCLMSIQAPDDFGASKRAKAKKPAHHS